MYTKLYNVEHISWRFHPPHVILTKLSEPLLYSKTLKTGMFQAYYLPHPTLHFHHGTCIPL